MKCLCMFCETTSDAAVVSRYICSIWPQLQAASCSAQLVKEAPLRVAETVIKNRREQIIVCQKVSALFFSHTHLFSNYRSSFRPSSEAHSSNESICARRRQLALKWGYIIYKICLYWCYIFCTPMILLNYVCS